MKPLVSLSRYCFVLLFSISFLAESAFAFSIGQFSIGGREHPVTVGAVIYSKQKPSDFPVDFTLFAISDGTEDTETESEGDSGCEIDFCFLGIAHTALPDANLGKSSLLNFVSLIRKREPVSLIVLHHSWKNHIA